MAFTQGERQRLLSDAAALARRVRRPVSRGLILLKVAKCQSNDAHAAEAAAVLREVLEVAEGTDQPDRGVLMIGAATCLAMGGDVPRAEKVFEEVEAQLHTERDVVDSHGLLFRLAEAYCDLNWYDRALGLADRVSQGVHKDGILVAVSRKHAAKGELVRALDAVRRLDNPSSRSSELATLILEALEKTEIGEAEKELLQRIASLERSAEQGSS